MTMTVIAMTRAISSSGTDVGHGHFYRPLVAVAGDRHRQLDAGQVAAKVPFKVLAGPDHLAIYCRYHVARLQTCPVGGDAARVPLTKTPPFVPK